MAAPVGGHFSMPGHDGGQDDLLDEQGPGDRGDDGADRVPGQRTQGDADHPEAGRGDHRAQAVVLAYETGLFDPDARPAGNRHEGPAR
jgi:hypothetical protein